jgi:hypothetical protein
MLIQLNWAPGADWQQVFDLEFEIRGERQMMRDVHAREIMEADDERAEDLLSIVQPTGEPLFLRV